MNKSRKRKRKIRWGRVSLVILTLVLIVTCCIAHPLRQWKRYRTQAALAALSLPSDSVRRHALSVDSILCAPYVFVPDTDAQGRIQKHRILSVRSYAGAFPDENDVQLTTATQLGLRRFPKTHDEAAAMTHDLVFIGASPLFALRPMKYSAPYLTPRADRLLEAIARAFEDSLLCKGLPAHKLEVSSALRTLDDVKRLQRRNVNAKSRSCHLYGTTFDISYNYYAPVSETCPPDTAVSPYGLQLKQVLAEVLRDMRQKGTCYVKYERKEPCFHITCR